MNEAQKHTHLDASRERLTYIRLDTNMAFRRMKTHLFTEIIPSLHAIHVNINMSNKTPKVSEETYSKS